MKKWLDKTVASEAETIQFGRELALKLEEGAIVALHGDLGAGKTTLAKGMIAGISSTEVRNIQSPTFTYLNIYENSIYHFDLYRLKGADDFIQLGFLDFLGDRGICLIEWAERISSLLPEGIIHVQLSHLGEGMRKIDVYQS
jgi:tRNA threonylcarbamoyladenosine biosynthesis protein TsaE